jgi:hypothetical protein
MLMSLSGLSPFRPVRAAWYSVAALSAFVLLMPLAASGQSAAPARPVAVTSGNSGAEAPAAGGRETTAPAAPQARSLHLPFAAQNGNTAESKSLSTRVIGKVKQVTNSINDIFGRVPCLAPKRRVNPVGTLPHVAAKLAAGQPVVIVAFGSSSTEGFGATSPEYTCPNGLAAQLRRHYPTADITVVNAGHGGEVASEMMERLQSSVLDRHPNLVIWQVGTNAVLRHLDPDPWRSSLDRDWDFFSIVTTRRSKAAPNDRDERASLNETKCRA